MADITGRCECGKVRFSVDGARDTVTVCHCSQCRRNSGHLWASTHAPFDAVTFETDEGLTWFASSAWAKRGFCSGCGSTLFYRLNDEDGIAIAAGCLDDASALKVSKHIFVGSKGPYYEIADGLPQIETY